MRPHPARPTRLPVLTALVLMIMLLAPTGVSASTCWRPPVVAPVVDPFRPPACRWCPGNRGIEYGTRSGQPVWAVESGRVRFAGDVAGTMYVVVQHRDGRRVTYGRLSERRVDVGDLVLGGRIIGTATASFHFGVRVGDHYVDPADSIGRLVGRPRLVPTDGSAAAPAPPPLVRCRGAISESAR